MQTLNDTNDIVSNQGNHERWVKELDDSLSRAIEAEAERRLDSAEWLFQRALFFEAKLQNMPDARSYVATAGPVYGYVES